MENFIKIIELFINLLIGISWPTTIIIIIVLFKSQLDLTLSKLNEYISKSKLTIDKGKITVQPYEQIPPKLSKLDDDSILEVSNPELQPYFNELINDYRDNKEKYLEEFNQLYPNWTNENIYLNVIADKQGALILERIRGDIFGSQVDLLDFATSSNGKISQKDVKSIYDEAEKIWPEMYPKYSYDNWKNYVIASGLFTEDEEYLHITNLGKAFKPYFQEKNIGVRKHY